MRNKITLAMALAGMMCGTSAFAADAGGGQIIFSGSVIDAPCSIVPESQNIQVNLGQVSAKSLKNAGATSSAVPIIINLTGCSFDEPPTNGTSTNYSKVAVDFPGVPAPETSDGTLGNGEIKNMASNSPATKVAIQLLKSDASTPVKLDTPPANGDINLDTTSGNNQLKFFARMISVAGGATSGSVGATVTYKLKYF
ncbi:fimbrial protein [Salmonella enterica]|nr:long polar fimbrial protein LpfA [Salmonella enterica]EBY8519357.1 long polar fimbrial protein LpfA [Salmonella enterica subsp. enterica serovar Braenderup]ECA5284489.1 long polar fimbrial protein LpfA [Salmonella enterica subsp. enterica serovar Braenderup]EDB9194615.1 fimbrial protein [Salmonella enterica]EDR9546282.1 fimbrial protein [Salmonella enterica]